MKPQAEFRKVLVVWAILVGLVIVGMAVGKWMWKQRETEKRDAARTAIAREALATVGKAIDCLKHGKRDLVSGAIAHAIETPVEKLCGGEIEPLSRTLLAAADKLGMKLDVPSAPLFDDFDDHAELEELCPWAGSLGAAADQLAVKARLSKVTMPPCDLEAHALDLIEPPVGLGGNSVSTIRAGSELVLQYRDDASGSYVIAKRNETLWQTQVMPPHWYAGYAWVGERMVATVSERPGDENSPYLVHVRDSGNKWQRRARIAVPVITSVLLHGERDIAIVGSDFAPGNNHLILRSTDDGKTFPRKATLADGQLTRSIDATMQPDGSVLVLASRGKADTALDVQLLEPSAKAPRSLKAFTWATPGSEDHPALESCRDGKVHWALVRGRYLVVSDDGAEWREVKQFPGVLDVHEVACTADRFAFTAGPEAATVRSCDRKTCSEPIAFRRSDGAAVALRFDGANLALWLGTRFSLVHLRTGEPAALAVYRVDGAKLVLDRVHIAESSGKLPVVLDKNGFFQLAER